MRQFWKFAKPKGPGFGISKNFYLSVLAGVPVLPPITELIAPKPEGGTLDGFGVPLVDTNDKSLLAQPMQRGIYALSTKDQKNVVRMMVMNADEAGFSPEAIATSRLAERITPEVLTRIRSTWHLVQLSWESHDPEVYPALDVFLRIARRLAEITDGIVADPISERYLLPDQVFVNPRVDSLVDAREHVYIHSRPDQGMLHVYTKGLIKIGQPEIELSGVPQESYDQAGRLLMSAAQGVFMGFLISSGSDVAGFEAREGGHDKSRWEGIPVLELLPPTGMPVGQVLANWER
jgi:hypothetical protein